MLFLDILDIIKLIRGIGMQFNFGQLVAACLLSSDFMDGFSLLFLTRKASEFTEGEYEKSDLKNISSLINCTGNVNL